MKVIWLVCISLTLLFTALSRVAIGGNVSYDGRFLIINGSRQILFSGSIHYPRRTPQGCYLGEGEEWSKFGEKMAVSNSIVGVNSNVPAALHSLQRPKDYYGRFSFSRKFLTLLGNRSLTPMATSDPGGSSASLRLDVSFPCDYSELLKQATKATELAIKDNKKLMEIEFPTAGLESVPGDGEGGIEMTESMSLIREFCDQLIRPEKAALTRVFFPEANEVKFAKQSVFEGARFKLDYLTKPSFFEDFGFVEKVKMADRVNSKDELFLVAYPYFNVNEMLVVEELYKEAVVNTGRKLIIFNGELDRIRSGYYPPFFYPKLAALSKSLFPMMETIYYIHNFKGQKGGTLFRCYPEPWKVLRKVGNKYFCIHQQESMPSLKEVALNILPAA